MDDDDDDEDKEKDKERDVCVESYNCWWIEGLYTNILFIYINFKRKLDKHLNTKERRWLSFVADCMPARKERGFEDDDEEDKTKQHKNGGRKHT